MAELFLNGGRNHSTEVFKLKNANLIASLVFLGNNYHCSCRMTRLEYVRLKFTRSKYVRLKLSDEALKRLFALITQTLKLSRFGVPLALMKGCVLHHCWHEERKCKRIAKGW